MSQVFDIKARVKEILSCADLHVITAKKVRKQLEAELKTSLDKQSTDDIIMNVLLELQPVVNTEDNSADIKYAAKVAVTPAIKDPVIVRLNPAADLPAPVISAPQQAPSSYKNLLSGGSKRKYISAEIISDDSDNDDYDQNAMVLNDEEYARKVQIEDSRSTRRNGTSRTKAVKAKKSKKIPDGSSSQKRNTGFNQALLISPALKDIIHVEKASRGETVKLVWEYIKSNNLQDPSDKRFILCDEKLMKVMDNKKRVNSFGMNRFISNHLFKPEEVVDPNAETPSVKEPAKKKAKKKSSEGGARGGFTKPYELSEDLQKVVKSALLPRTQVVKKIWEYIKEKSLQDPQDGRFIICDENLFNLFGKKRVSSFEMNKYISKHLYPASSDNTTVPEDSNPGTPAEAAKSEVLDDDSVDDE